MWGCSAGAVFVECSDSWLPTKKPWDGLRIYIYAQLKKFTFLTIWIDTWRISFSCRIRTFLSVCTVNTCTTLMHARPNNDIGVLWSVTAIGFQNSVFCCYKSTICVSVLVQQKWRGIASLNVRYSSPWIMLQWNYPNRTINQIFYRLTWLQKGTHKTYKTRKTHKTQKSTSGSTNCTAIVTFTKLCLFSRNDCATMHYYSFHE